MPTHQSGKAIDRRDFLKILPALGATVASPAGAQTRRKANILVIVTDDHGIGDVGCYGHPEVRTPNLDRVAASGVRFTEWYSNAPTCSASRAAILTARNPDRTGVKGALSSEPTWDVPAPARPPSPASCANPATTRRRSANGISAARPPAAP